MTGTPDFDLDAAHRYFSAHCFNAAWDLLDKQERTPEENEQMIRLCLASAWHWTQRADCTPTNLSVGYWQASRIYAVLGQGDNARRYGQMCLAASQSAGAPSISSTAASNCASGSPRCSACRLSMPARCEASSLVT